MNISASCVTGVHLNRVNKNHSPPSFGDYLVSFYGTSFPFSASFYIFLFCSSWSLFLFPCVPSCPDQEYPPQYQSVIQVWRIFLLETLTLQSHPFSWYYFILFNIFFLQDQINIILFFMCSFWKKRNLTWSCRLYHIYVGCYQHGYHF